MKLVDRSDEAGRSYDIPEGDAVIGRSSSCDITVRSATLSKRHALVSRRGPVVSIRDLDTTNGTFVNGKRITTINLNPGDMITLGRHNLAFEAPELAGQAPGAQNVPPKAGQAGPEQPEPVFFDEPGTAGTQQPAPEPAPPPMPGGPIPADAPMPDGQPFDAGDGSPDDTPVDADFVPARYEPERQVSPEFVARGDKWFIRDPASSREVEIVPKGGTYARPDVSSYYDEQRKKKITHIVIAAVGIVVVLMAILIAIPDGDNRNIETPPAFPNDRYTALLDDGLEALDARKFKAAREKFSAANNGLPKRRAAGIMLEIARLWEEAGEDMAKLDWNAAQANLYQLEEVPASVRTPKLRAFAEEWITWIAQENNQQLILQSATDQFDNNEPEQAFATLKALNKESSVYAKAEDFIEKVRATCERRTLARAQQLKESRDWDEAITTYESARPYVGEEALAMLDEDMAFCRQGIQQKEQYDAAVVLAEQERFNEAKDALQLIPRKSPYGDDAASLLASVERAMKMQQANRLFDAGNGEEALKYIKAERLDDPRLEDLIVKVMDLTRKADDLYNQQQKYYEAIKIWEKIIRLLNDRLENKYRADAKAGVDRLRGDPTFLAKVYADKAQSALDERKPEDARRFAMIANESVPGFGDAVLKALITQAKRFYADGLGLFAKGEPEQAEEKFRLVLRYATPQDQEYERAVHYISKIKQGESVVPR